MARDLLNEYLRLRSRLLAERELIKERLAELDRILGGLVSPDLPAIAPTTGLKPRKAARPKPAPDRGEREAEPASPIFVGKWEVRLETCEFPVGMFPFPARAHSAFERSRIQKLGQLNGVGPEALEHKNIGATTLAAITELLQRVNRGELSFPPDRPVPTHSFAALIDSGLAAFDEPTAVTVQQRFGNGMTLEAIGSQLGLTRERVRQLEAIALRELPRVHGAKVYQIGKALGILSRTKAIEFSDISEAGQPPKFSPQFYFTLLGSMFPGLRGHIAVPGPAIAPAPAEPESSVNESPVPASPTEPSPAEDSPADLRERIFGSESVTA